MRCKTQKLTWFKTLVIIHRKRSGEFNSITDMLSSGGFENEISSDYGSRMDNTSAGYKIEKYVKD
jgi:hypothetical protein